jgi:hypothetical protein
VSLTKSCGESKALCLTFQKKCPYSPSREGRSPLKNEVFQRSLGSN